MPARRSHASSSTSSGSLLRKAFFLGIIVFGFWCFIAPATLFRNVNTHSSLEDLTKERRAPQSQGAASTLHTIHKPSIPPTPKNGPWTLQDATEDDQIDQLDWYEKGRLIIQKNTAYLHSSIGKGNSTNSSITLVSGLFDLGRGDLKNDFVRSFQTYVDRFSVFLRYQFPKIIFIQPEHYHLYVPLIDKSEYPIYVVNATLDEIRAFSYYNEVQKIRTNPDWYGDANGWLANAPQATLPLYNPMVMSKLFWTRNAARVNPFNTDSFLWIDGGHNCNAPDDIFQSNADVFRAHFDKLLITYFDYEPYEEIHGFKRKAFYDYIDHRATIILVGRGGIFGGTREFLEISSQVYDLALEDTLKSGFMGTEENIFSILLYRFPELVHEYLNGDGGNCAIFYEAIHGPQPPPVPRPVYTLAENGMDLRGAKCEYEDDTWLCFTDGRQCPSFVTPAFLDAAKGQYGCQDDNSIGFYCHVSCTNDEIFWFRVPCPNYDICPPHGTIDPSDLYKYEEKMEEDPIQGYVYENKNYGDENGLNLRGCSCTGRNEHVICTDEKKNICPAIVTPLWLDIAEDKSICNEEKKECFLSCIDGSIIWEVRECKDQNASCQSNTVHWSTYFDQKPQLQEEEKLPIQTYTYEVPHPSPFPKPKRNHEKHFNDREINFMREIKANYDGETREYLHKYGYDLRGIDCEFKDGKEVCFMNHRNGRDLCPEYVDSAYLSLAAGQYACTGMVEDTYCTAQCQEGTDRVSWTAGNIEWCAQSGDCRDIPEVIPYDDFYLKEWTLGEMLIKPCLTFTSDVVEEFKRTLERTPISVGILSRGNEIPTLQTSMNTWIEDGFLQYIDEVLIMVNEMTTEMETFLAPFTLPPYNLKVLQSPNNEGILRGINWLMGNSTNKHFMFLEKDFRLVEPLSCVLEQLLAGIDMIDSDVAQVVKYRSRYNAGKPNWAEVSYKGREEEIFNIQPNLLCNFYHWIDEPAQRWPDHFEVCHSHPVFFCVDSFFCNWTNNPFLINKLWWYENFMLTFPEIRHPTADFALEGFMNWHHEIWNNAGWTVASGDGLFKHCDANNFGQ